MRGDDLGYTVRLMQELQRREPTLSAHAAAMLVVALEVQSLRRELRSAQTADLTALVDAFREEAPALSAAAQRAAEVAAGGARVLDTEEKLRENGPGVMAECTVCGEYRRCLDGICRDCDSTPESG